MTMVVTCITLAACDNDDDTGSSDGSNGSVWTGKVYISNVFTGKKTIKINNKVATYDCNGLLVSLEEPISVGYDYHNVTFEYGKGTRAAADNYVRMTNEVDNGCTTYWDMKLNRYGFVESCRETYDDGDPDYDAWYFDYDNDGHLIHIKEIWNDLTDEDERYITWKDGNIVSVERSYGGSKDKYSISYFKSDNTMTENKGCIMLYEAMGTGLDMMQWAYYAGLLGKPTKNLPCSLYRLAEGQHSEKGSCKLTWTLDSNGYPVKVDYAPSNGTTFTDITGYGAYAISSFAW